MGKGSAFGAGARVQGKLIVGGFGIPAKNKGPATSAECRLRRAEHAGDFPKIPFILRSPPTRSRQPRQRGSLIPTYRTPPLTYQPLPLTYQPPPLTYRAPPLTYRTSIFTYLFYIKIFIIIRRILNKIKGFRDIGIKRRQHIAVKICLACVCACARPRKGIRKKTGREDADVRYSESRRAYRIRLFCR